MIVNKARNMASMMKVPVLGMVENMSYITCPHCGEQIHLFGNGKIDEIARKNLLSPSNVKMTLLRTREKLREELRKEGYAV